jgi:hypothetical protein
MPVMFQPGPVTTKSSASSSSAVSLAGSKFCEEVAKPLALLYWS